MKKHRWVTPEERARETVDLLIERLVKGAHAEIRAMTEAALGKIAPRKIEHTCDALRAMQGMALQEMAMRAQQAASTLTGTQQAAYMLGMGNAYPNGAYRSGLSPLGNWLGLLG